MLGLGLSCDVALSLRYFGVVWCGAVRCWGGVGWVASCCFCQEIGQILGKGGACVHCSGLLVAAASAAAAAAAAITVVAVVVVVDRDGCCSPCWW